MSPKEAQDVDHTRLGDQLVERDIITEEQLDKALRQQKDTGDFLGEVIIDMGYARPSEVYEVVGDQTGLPRVDLSQINIDRDLSDLVPERFARRFTVLPIELDEGTLKLAVTDHLDVVALDTIASNTGHNVQPLLANRETVERAIEMYYSRQAADEESLEDIVASETQREGSHDQVDVDELESEASDAPVVRFVDLLLRQAIDNRASDLHIEPRKDDVRVRARIDGELRKFSPPTKNMLGAVVSRIKILSGLDIGERRLPQDGRFRIDARNIDVRVSTMPTIYGEKVVMRLLNKDRLVLGLSELGFEGDQQADYEKALQRPQGIILVTGPTGSGKTTTLYSGLSTINTIDKNIVTIEDPVECELSGINQTQVRPNIGLTFAAGLRSMLRQDPDIVMVGEIRDVETADIAIRAALTGHLVLSTLHTNSAVASINRLHDMGVKPYLLGSCLSLLCAQRLVRKICDNCREPYDPPRQALEDLGLPMDHTYYRGRGCTKCSGSGYYGRFAVYETLPVNNTLRKLICSGAGEEQIREATGTTNFVPLRQAGAQKVLRGDTTPEEIVSKTMR
ncbi:MAG: GspE/PulE family protein [Planctomycetota bacterium]